MTRLIAKSAADGLLPVEIGAARLTEEVPAAITSVEKARGARTENFAKALGVAFPAPNRTTGKAGARAIWAGPDLCFWIGAAPARIAGHALTDQSDGWALLRLEGAAAADVLARLTPVDLRPARFRRGHTSRTLLGHLPVSLTRGGDAAFEILCFRSMTRTAVHDLTRAMQSVAARS